MSVEWLAGLLEGEGHFSLVYKHSVNGDRYPTFRVGITMTDEDVIRHAAAEAGVGTVTGPHQPQKSHHSQFWRWQVYRRDDVYELCLAVRPFMGERRTARIDEIIAAYENSGRRPWRHGTRHGYEWRGCRCDKCRAANAARHRLRRARLRAAPDSVDSIGVSADVG